MLLYLYAIAEGIEHLGDMKGLSEESLAVLPVGSASVIAGRMATVPLVSRESLMAQDTVVRALHARAHALLPMRFGSSVADIDALIRLLDPLAVQVTERCALVRGREQMTIRALGASAEGASGAAGASSAGAWSAKGARSAAGAGARYLTERAARRTPPELVPLMTALSDVPRATRIEQGRTPSVVATIYHLIDRGTSEGYRQRVEAAASASPGLSLRVSGPAPAYAFAALSAP